MKNSVKCLCVAFSAALMCMSATAAGFSKTRTYSATFDDVKKDAWYYDSVAASYEYGLVNGKSDTSFAPSAQMTVAEGITLVSRIHSIYVNDGYDFNAQQKNAWYDPYVNYAKKEGYLKDTSFDSYTRNIKRFELATLIYDALDEKEFVKINDVKVIPDVAESKPYYSKLLALYNAGIVLGNDAYGTFLPESNITRSEVAAIAVRAADASMRKKGTLENQTVNTLEDSYYLIDEDRMTSDKNGVASGFTVDNKNDVYNVKGDSGVSNLLSDTETDYYSALHRDFQAQTSGILTFETVLDITNGKSGFELYFKTSDGAKVFTLHTDNGKFVAHGSKSNVTNAEITDAETTFALKLVLNLDSNMAEFYLDGKNCGEFDIADVKDIASLSIGTKTEEICSVLVHTVKLYSGYAVNDTFLVSDENNAVTLWEMSGFEIADMQSNPGYDNYSVKSSDSTQKAVARRRFSPISGKLVFEANILLPKAHSGVKIVLGTGAYETVSVYTQDNKLMCAGKVLREYTPNVWQHIRIEADTDKGSADICINGKKLATVDFGVNYADFVEISNADKSAMWFDDVSVYAAKENNVPAPDVASSDGYNVGIHVCNLWHAGSAGEGWAAVSAFDELTPYLGYYDEGNADVASWELKWMAEHGIDFQHICWYSPSNDVMYPIKKPTNSEALHNGYFNSEYSKYVDFCIMWENNNCNILDIEQFKEYFWKYWKDYYFTDERYVVLDNKPVLTIWNYQKLKNDLGSDSAVKELLDFMREDIKTLGFDDMIIMFSDSRETSDTFFEGISKTGADAVYSYSYHRYGSDPDYQINRMNDYDASDIIHHVPVASVGFNDVGRNEHRSPMITNDGFEKVLTYIKDTYLPNQKTNTWMDNTVLLSTWNEFSEGTYISPAKSNGFGYLDAIRKVFTKAESHTDSVPGAKEISEMGRLFPENYSPIRRLFLETEESESAGADEYTAFKVWDFKEESARKVWDRGHGLDTLERNAETIAGQSPEKDFAIFVRGIDEQIDSTRSILHIRIKHSNLESFPTNMEVFYVTKEDSTYEGQKKHLVIPCTGQGEYIDYYIDMSVTGGWEGTLKEIRFDPAQTPSRFEISLAELMSKSASSKVPDIYINTHKMDFAFKPVYDSTINDCIVTGDPRLGFFSMLRTYYRYYPDDKKLVLESKDARLEFVIGSDAVTVNGEKKNLGYTFELRDGLPVFRLRQLTELLGYTYKTESNGDISVLSASEKVLDIIQGIQGASWMFDIEGNNETWTTQASDGKVADGTYTCTTTGSDPALHSGFMTIDASVCKKMRIRMSLEKDNTGGFIQVFFAKDKNGKMSEEQSVKFKYEDGFSSTNGEYRDFVIDMTQNQFWNGTITKFRIDPFNGNGKFSIDYIIFE